MARGTAHVPLGRRDCSRNAPIPTWKTHSSPEWRGRASKGPPTGPVVEAVHDVGSCDSFLDILPHEDRKGEARSCHTMATGDFITDNKLSSAEEEMIFINLTGRPKRAR
ncbi:hypothetical protein JZ751_021599 [Albula glossodonta]|uniref:Uncharacterized protein n=1 Tax=Albula glossodonta TaxID=121402 RepID=A0A8T2NLD9_9TELE|nr:hypothetical protein JZ751_021599 [Albula glossodonta]